jgi:hypothetical protein
VKVRLNVAPGAIVPEFQDPSSPTEVCASVSLLVQLTVSPAAIVIGFGAYAVFVKLAARLTIETGVPLTLVPPDGEEGEYELQPIVRPITPARMLNRRFMLFSIRCGYRKRVATTESENSLAIVQQNRNRYELLVSEKSKCFLTP